MLFYFHGCETFIFSLTLYYNLLTAMTKFFMQKLLLFSEYSEFYSLPVIIFAMQGEETLINLYSSSYWVIGPLVIK